MSRDGGFDLKTYLQKNKDLVDNALDGCLPKPRGHASDLVESMRYSLFAGGKRLRPVMCIAGAEIIGGNPDAVMPAACALEFIHTYSLIHDDLPVMDDDDLRRGKPTNHKVFGEAIAVLAGDALLTEAFNILSGPGLTENSSPEAVIRVIGIISRAAGFDGMVAGQVTDIQSEGDAIELPVLEFIHAKKTAALITAAVVSGAVLAGAEESEISALKTYGHNTGLAFQISDDILDVEGDSKTMGKEAGSDVRKDKATYPSVSGLDSARQVQKELIENAVQSLKPFGAAGEPLLQIAHYVIERKK